jgi:hypothetical protein
MDDDHQTYLRVETVQVRRKIYADVLAILGKEIDLPVSPLIVNEI